MEQLVVYRYLDVVINKPFKNYIREEFEKHIDENLELYVEGKLLVSERRILTTKWVANAWEKIKRNPEMIIHGFLKCGLSNKLDGSEDDYLNINGIENYKFPEISCEFELEDVEDSADSEDNDDELVEIELQRSSDNDE